MKITFKNAAVDDIDKIFDLNKKLIEQYETNKNLNFPKVFTWVRTKIEKNIESYNCIYLDEIKTGYYYLHDQDEKLELDDFFVFNEFQSTGIGTKVLNYISSSAKEKNKDVFLYVFAKNQGAINLYLRNAYKVTKNIGNSRYIMTLPVKSRVDQC
jgi:ribosomal protein S18 acetylase RimI-like enzyme